MKMKIKIRSIRAWRRKKEGKKNKKRRKKHMDEKKYRDKGKIK